MIKIIYYLLFLFVFISCTYSKNLSKENIAQYSTNNIDDDLNSFINKLISENLFSREYLNNFFSKVVFQSSIIDIMNNPSTSVPWYYFIQKNITKEKISDGVDFYIRNEQVLRQVYEKYKVPPEIIIATLGIETNYGKYNGNFNVADSLYTLSFYYPRRAKYFQNELKEFLLMVNKNNIDPYLLKGSYAGAMGYPQFMPSSFNKYAKSYNNLEFPDIWNNVSDAIMSIANYYHNQGWTQDDLLIIEVKLKSNILKNIINDKVSLKYNTVGKLKKLGLLVPLKKIDDSKKAVLFKLETSPNKYKYYIGLNNFHVIWKYNNSINYVCAVYTMAMKIKYQKYLLTNKS